MRGYSGVIMRVDVESLTEPVASVLAGDRGIDLPLRKRDLREHPRLAWFAEQGATHLFPNGREPECAYSGLLLLLGGWRQCHERAQEIAGPAGSYWHAIAHRMEPDFSNSGYWYRRTGTHPIFAELRDGASTLAQSAPGVDWSVPDVWDPFLFLELCEEADKAPGGSVHALATAIQGLEWELLFGWCSAPVRG